MKNCVRFSLWFLLLILSSFFTNAQGIKQKDILILQKITEHTIKFGCTEKQLLYAFGNPDSSKKYFFEMDKKNGKLLTYQNCEFYFLDDKLISFNFKFSAYQILIAKNSTPIAVGQSSKFPAGISKKSSKFVAYDIKGSNGITTDRFLEFDLRADKRVDKITLSDY